MFACCGQPCLVSSYSISFREGRSGSARALLLPQRSSRLIARRRANEGGLPPPASVARIETRIYFLQFAVIALPLPRSHEFSSAPVIYRPKKGRVTPAFQADGEPGFAQTNHHRSAFFMPSSSQLLPSCSGWPILSLIAITSLRKSGNATPPSVFTMRCIST